VCKFIVHRKLPPTGGIMKKNLALLVTLVCMTVLFAATVSNALGPPPEPKKSSKTVKFGLYSQYVTHVMLNFKGDYIINKSYSEPAGVHRRSGASGNYTCNKKIVEGNSGGWLSVSRYNTEQTEEYDLDKHFTFKKGKQTWNLGPSGNRTKVSIRWAREYGCWYFHISDE
jgi:hypothetical protein